MNVSAYVIITGECMGQGSITQKELAERLGVSIATVSRALNDQPGVSPEVRDRVLRGRRSWVPAVLRFTAAQNAVLLEACNMANTEDRALLQQSAWREQFARAVVEGMASAFAK